MLPVFTKDDILKWRDNEKILEDTILQIKKDFALFGMDIEFPEDINFAYQTLFDQLELQIHDLLENNNPKLMSLLYQIDISEEDIKRKTLDTPEVLFSEVITEMIIERELRKVLTRMYFREQGYK